MRRGGRAERRAKETRETTTATAAAKGWERRRLQQWRRWRWQQTVATARVQAPATAAVLSRLHQHLAEHRWSSRRTRPTPPTWRRARSCLLLRREERCGAVRDDDACTTRSEQTCANRVEQQGRWSVGSGRESGACRERRIQQDQRHDELGRGLAQGKDNLEGNVTDFGKEEKRWLMYGERVGIGVRRQSRSRERERERERERVREERRQKSVADAVCVQEQEASGARDSVGV